MNIKINKILPRTTENISKTIKLALNEAHRRQVLADKNLFNHNNRTCNIEQEVRIANRLTGEPVNVECLSIPDTIKVRFDTSVDNLEYDANGITPLTLKGIKQLYRSFLNKTRQLQEIIKRNNPDAILVPIGVQPLIREGEWKRLIVSNPDNKIRYQLMEAVVIRENTNPQITITNPDTKKTFIDKASNLSVMTRTSGTQFHISEKSLSEAIQAYNISIAIAPIMIALFGNSPFLGGIDTGRSSSRIEILRQGEQKKAGLPEPASSIEDYYIKQLAKAEPSFIEIENPEKALDLSMSAIHTVTRIIIDTKNNTIRNEFRHIDSQSPYRSIQAFLLTLGLIEGLRKKKLPEFKESQANFEQSVWGLKAKMSWLQKDINAKELGLWSIKLAQATFLKTEMTDIVRSFLDPLKREIMKGQTQAEIIRNSVKKNIMSGKTLEEAIIQDLKRMNREMLYFGTSSGLIVSSSILNDDVKKGYTKPRPIQDQTIPYILEGKDV